MEEKKIGIITFHWGTNYGGILQCFALQKYLSDSFGFKVKIINYAPKTFRDNPIKIFLTKSLKNIPSNLKDYYKDRVLEGFRRRNLDRTKRYYSEEELKQSPPNFEFYISGSDQVWSHYIIDKHGAPYYLNFGANSVQRLAYAASFGSIEYPTNKLALLQKKLEVFDAISVRENGGLKILAQVDIKDAILLPDPVLLLDSEDYKFNVRKKVQRKTDSDYIFVYGLQSNQQKMNNGIRWLEEEIGIPSISTKNLNFYFSSIEEWLHYHRSSKFVLTNSYHGVLFSLIFKKNFLVFPIEGALSGMNDRLFTLLDKFDLNERLVNSNSKNELLSKLNSQIDWTTIQSRILSLREGSRTFFERNIGSIE